MFFADAVETPPNVFLDSGLIDVSYLKGTEGLLSFVLNSTGEPNAQFVVQDFQFFNVVPEPSTLSLVTITLWMLSRRRTRGSTCRVVW